jgi:hypothetical protein
MSNHHHQRPGSSGPAGLALPDLVAQRQAEQAALQKAINGIFLNLLYSLVSGRTGETREHDGRLQLVQDARELTLLAAAAVGIQIEVRPGS